ncbi:hypothetical protein GGR65_004333 [Xanthomonas sp. 3376]|nr:hypothetical protein [Xanthomonas arboricola]
MTAKVADDAGGAAQCTRQGMTDLVLRDIDPLLVDRIRRISVARGWTQHQTVMHLLEQGLFASEYEVTGGLQHPEVDALAEAIAALKALPAGNSP